MTKHEYLEKALTWVKKRASVSIKAKNNGYDDPQVFTSRASQEKVQADFSFITRKGEKHYTDIALKSEKPQRLVTRWKLLSTMASLKDGKLHLLTPRGHKSFTRKLVQEYNIRAAIYSL
ncbi:MAG: hypothetical protein ACPGJS_02095 [Flammeovirgaceae bacterium]